MNTLPRRKYDTKYIDCVGIRVGSDSYDKLASGVPEEDKEFYNYIMQKGMDSKKHKMDEVVLVLAITDWEHYGPNDNGDGLFGKPFFRITEEGTLPSTHRSFITRAMVSRNHQYKTPDQAIGEVLDAFYNKKYGRVEVLIRYDWEKAAGECRKIARNKSLLVSMGYRIFSADLPDASGEFCSYCGHHNRIPRDRCDHLASMIGTLVDGVPVYMMNGIGYFVDISSVVIPGDFNARTILRASEKSESGTEKV